MALWIVTSDGALGDQEPDIEDLGGRFVAAHRAGERVEMLVEGDDAMIGRLATLPKVRAVVPAPDGQFADDADGVVVVEGGAWRRLPRRAEPTP